ncbi:hypothetical protein BJ912DRAFT_1051969 [Pholiota molesta]|nr:hypothetical protein BJ912DRAFT_1051969 [Pholiota molesta]
MALGQNLFRFFHMHLYPRPDMPVHPEVERLDSNTFPILRPAEILTVRCCLQSAHFVQTAIAQPTNVRIPTRVQEKISSAARGARLFLIAAAIARSTHGRVRITPQANMSVLRSLIGQGGGEALFFGTGASFCPDITMIIENWKKAGVREDEFMLVEDWYLAIMDGRGYPMPDGTEWTPGYDDYNEIIADLSAQGRGPKAKFLNRLARWPSEVAKEERLLKVQAFWGEDIIY